MPDRKGVRRYHLYLLYSSRVSTTDRRSANSEETKLQINGQARSVPLLAVITWN